MDVTLYDGIGTLDKTIVPTGMMPDKGYEGGAWDKIPDTTPNALTGDVTYTYTFTKIPPVETKAKVTFKVVNGTWDGTDREKKVVDVTLYDGVGTLDKAFVPTGMKPNEGYEGGAWVQVPDTAENALTRDVTYTYLFLEKPAEKVTVKFDANGGTGTMADAVLEKGTKYELPSCSFTAPKGKVFDKWDVGKTGEEITVSENMTIKALWKDKAPDVPQTGGNSHIGLWAAVSLISLCGIAALLIFYRKKHNGGYSE